MYNRNNFIGTIKEWKLQLHDSITRENLRILMTLFYERTMLDAELGPFFTNELGDDITNALWLDHIDLLTDFWLAKLMDEDTYKGNVFGMHTRVPHIKRESFAIWMKLFSTAADEVYIPELAERFKEKGKSFSSQFIEFLRI